MLDLYETDGTFQFDKPLLTIIYFSLSGLNKITFQSWTMDLMDENFSSCNMNYTEGKGPLFFYRYLY